MRMLRFHKYIRPLLVLLLAAVVLWPAWVAYNRITASDTRWKAAISAANRDMASSRWGKAKANYLRSIREARKFGWNDNRVITSELQAVDAFIYILPRKEPTNSRILACTRDIFMPGGLSASVSQKKIRQLVEQRREYQSVRSFLRHARTVQQQRYGSDSSQLVPVLVREAYFQGILERQNDHTTLRKAMSIWKIHKQPVDHATAEYLIYYSENWNNYHSADIPASLQEEIYLCSLSMQERSFGHTDKRLRDILQRLYWLYLDRADYHNAERYLSRSWQVVTPAYASNIEYLSQLANFYDAWSRKDPSKRAIAKQAYLRAIETARLQHKRTGDITVNSITFNYATFLMRNGCQQEANRLYPEITKIVFFEP